jgi:hypothetical protein
MRAYYRVNLCLHDLFDSVVHPGEGHPGIENILPGFDVLPGQPAGQTDYIAHGPGHQVSPLANICFIIYEHSTVYELNLYIIFRHKSSRNGIHGPG